MTDGVSERGPRPPRPMPEHVRVLVVGAGFGGLGAAIRLREQGERDVLVLERAADVGGTWRDNTYPGAACDVPSQLYSFSFAPNREWSRSFSEQPEIWAYLRRVAHEYAVEEQIRFGTALRSAAWDEHRSVWRVETDRGSLTAEVLVSAAGGLSEPRLPDIAGMGSFCGRVFHSARWDHGQDLTGKRVAVIGTGASSVQIVPAIVDTVGHLEVYQRTAPWVVPRHDRVYGRRERLALRHVPGLARLYRTGIYWARECYVPGFTLDPRLADPAHRLARSHLARSVADPGLRERLTPRYTIGCKRILVSSDYYPALTREHVDLVTEPIARFTERGIVTTDGVEREVDVVVVATGFAITEQPIAEVITGQHRRSLAEVWSDEGMTAYKGTTVHGFPNLFQIVGPNTGLGHSSMVFVIESQVAYLLDALRQMRRRSLGAVHPRAEAQRRWTARLQRRLRRSVWNTGGCSSWYLDSRGRNTTLWPRTTVSFRLRLRRFDARSYHKEPTSPRPRLQGSAA